MIEDVREAFSSSVQRLRWMDAATRARTLRKLAAIRTFVGFPSWLLTHRQLDQHYQHVSMRNCLVTLLSACRCCTTCLQHGQAQSPSYLCCETTM